MVLSRSQLGWYHHHVFGSHTWFSPRISCSFAELRALRAIAIIQGKSVPSEGIFRKKSTSRKSDVKAPDSMGGWILPGVRSNCPTFQLLSESIIVLLLHACHAYGCTRTKALWDIIRCSWGCHTWKMHTHGVFMPAKKIHCSSISTSTFWFT